MCICLQVELTDREFEKMLAEEEKQKMEKKKKKKQTTRREHRGPRSRILNRKSDRRSKAPMNESKSDESGDEVNFCGCHCKLLFVRFHAGSFVLLLLLLV